MKKLKKRFTRNMNTVDQYGVTCFCGCNCSAYCSATWSVQQESNSKRNGVPVSRSVLVS